MERLRARRVVAGGRRGSSRPVTVDTEAGRFLTKLRGAAQGTAPLVAEVVVAELAQALGLPVPRRVLVAIDEDEGEGVPSDDRDGELLDLLARSRGLNLGFALMEGARDIRPEEAAAAPDDFAVPVLWLDALVQNVDRTPRNPNVLVWQRGRWLIDHGAALPFQYRWSAVREDSPRAAPFPLEAHLFGSRAAALGAWDERLAARLTREVLRRAVEEVPAEFLLPLLPPESDAERVARRRAAYEAYLWKRLKPPRAFAATAPASAGRAGS